MEAGDDITPCLDDRTLVIANHQSTGDVPFLMAAFNTRKQVLPNLMWIMDNIFKYTNFGIVSILHQDFFILSVSHKATFPFIFHHPCISLKGKTNRDRSIKALVTHLLESYVPRNRKWIVLFPEGGFLRKRKAVSQSYARKNNLPLMEYVSLPRVGALQAIMSTVGPHSAVKNNNSAVVANSKIKFLLKKTNTKRE